MDGSLGVEHREDVRAVRRRREEHRRVRHRPDAMRALIRVGRRGRAERRASTPSATRRTRCCSTCSRRSAKQNGPRDRRFRIEHVQHLRPADYTRFKELGVVASMQPYHVIDDGRWAEGRIGAKRCASSYAFRSLLDAGAKLAFGSDWPVAPLDPLPGIDAAVNRRTLDGKHPDGWFPEQRITVAEAIEAYTLGSAVRRPPGEGPRVDQRPASSPTSWCCRATSSTRRSATRSPRHEGGC